MPNWTKPQHDAIYARGGSLLVSAAAGSGKTAVLVERAISLICDEKQPVDADRLLIVTFSNAAAAEMKQRISARLSAMIREKPHDLFLQRQQAMLPAAQISTIHSFCLELLRANFQNLDISPDFSVADENELSILKLDCANSAIEQFYDNDKTGAFAELVELLSNGRDDRRLAETVLKIYDFSRSHPFSEDWLDDKLAMYALNLPVPETPWGESILVHAVDSLRFCAREAREALRMAESEEKMEKAYGGAFRSDLRQLEICLAAAKANNWDGLVASLQSFEFARLGALRGDDAEKERVKGVRARVKDTVQSLGGKYLNTREADFAADLADLQPKIATLFALVREFAARFAQAKAERHRLDFADFEHLALRLLVTKTQRGYERTEAARAISERFAHVLVDEYQDTNEVQDLIFTSVSREQQNLFMVGDVKQSIYAFRQAMPEIFLAKRRRFFPYESGHFPAKLNLDTNFRSRSEVTGAVNFLFGLLMSDKLGEVDYDADESLKCGAAYPDYPGANPELLLISAADYEGEKDMTALEAAEVAKRVREMLESGYKVADGGKLRPCEPQDFCILLRAPKNRADSYVRELTAQGVPAWAEQSGGYLVAREILAVVSLLKALDNPLLDIELAAAMLSPLFDFTDDDVAGIRLKARNVPFYTALCAAAETDEKAAGFLRLFRELRAQSAILPADRLIMQIYERTEAVAIFSAMPMGQSRAANLQLLVAYATEYHQLGYKQLGGFISFIKRLEENERDLAPAGGMGGGANVVRVMSVHHSKGLEFPVVILADTAKQFNRTDMRAVTMLHARYGFACVRRDHKRLVQFPTVPMQAVRLESERSMLSEELRILYVALTRAKEKLIVSALCKTGLQKKLAGLRCPLDGAKLEAAAARDANCYADWILMALLHHKSAAALREAAGAPESELREDGVLWNIILRAPVGDLDEAEAVPARKAAADPALLAELGRRTSFVYPAKNRVHIPAKLAVSDVAKEERSLAYRFSARPEFLTDFSMTAAEKGNAMHKFMQFSNYENARNDLKSEIARMEQQAFLSHAEAESLDRKRLHGFFESALAKRIFAAERVYRELKFMAECGREALGDRYPLSDGDKIVLQGVADCVFVEKSAAFIVDYKTDRVSDEAALVIRYAQQLALYRLILEKNLGMPVGGCSIYSFALGREIRL